MCENALIRNGHNIYMVKHAEEIKSSVEKDVKEYLNHLKHNGNYMYHQV
jgi:hypothetical protein